MIRTVIFDMDGVIVDTEPLHYQAFMKHFAELKINVSPEMYASFTGNSTKNVYQKIANHFQLDYDITEMVLRKRHFFNEFLDNSPDLQLLEGVENLIKDLSKNGMQMILASSSSNETINRIFERFGLDQYFDFKVSGEDFVQSKPDPAIFNKAASLSKFGKQHCIIIEDSTNGILGAYNADIYCVAYKSFHSKNQDLSLANKIINRFDELNFEIISNLKN